MEKFERFFTNEEIDDALDGATTREIIEEFKRSYARIEKLETELAEYKRQYEAACVTIDKFDDLIRNATELFNPEKYKAWIFRAREVIK